MVSKGWVHKLSAVCGIALAASAASAFLTDEAKILIDRALSSPTITVRYSGAQAVLAELRVNGTSYGTRSLSGTKSSGETNFTLDLRSLQAGDNEIEIRLFNKAGKLVGSQKQLVAADGPTDAPVFIRAPKMGSTVQGPIEIKVGFGRDLKNSYVSFFIDSQFRSMSNIAPYSYLWDTEREINGWHDLEAWVVDDNNATVKTQKVRVFVNNPGGETKRNKPAAKPANAGASTEKLVLGNSAGMKAVVVEPAVPSGAKLMTPTGKRVVKNLTEPKLAPVKSPEVGLVKIEKGQKLPNIGNYSIMLNSSFVKFDVEPRVENGVPLTPFRHLMEHAGGKVDWKHADKSVNAAAAGNDILLKIGDAIARINGLPITLELAPFIEKGRTIIPLSFIREALNVDVDYDKASGHVLITQAKK